MSGKYFGQEFVKRKSRDAARSRRGQQNDEYLELANQLPIKPSEGNQLDRLSVMRLANSYVKIKHVLGCLTTQDFGHSEVHPPKYVEPCGENLEELIPEALDGFVFVIGSDGRCLFISDNVRRYLGLLPIEMTGDSFYKYIHPCDHEEFAKELCGKIPLEDMEIFDGLFCSDSVFMMSNHLKGGSTNERDFEKQPYRSFFVRMKSTLTSRGKSVNLKASTYRVVHCMGRLKSVITGAQSDKEGSHCCFIGIGVPLMFNSTFEVPLDQATFSSHHSLDFSFQYSENNIEEILGYKPSEVVGQSLFKFLHVCDQDVLTNCHKTLLTKGQSVSGYYRLLAKYGGWVWVQTKASIVYSSKSSQPQFVLCVHYSISTIEQENNLVSLDQLQRQREIQESPSNSPADRTKSNIASRTRLPAIHSFSDMSLVQFQTGNSMGKGCAADQNLSTELLMDINFSDIHPENKEMPDIQEAAAAQTEYNPSLHNKPTTSLEKCKYLNSRAIHKDNYSPNDNPDQRAPFIPPPLSDTQMFSVNEKELEIFHLNSPFGCNEFVDEMSEISGDFEKEKQLSQKSLIKRKLSTPTFSLLTDAITEPA